MSTDLIPAGKLRCVITERLRSDTPEEHVRQRIARSIVEDYGYDKKDVEIEYPVNLGRAKKRVDIAIFLPETIHRQENIKIIVECKRDEIKPTDRDNGIEQLKSYMSACANTTFGMWIGSELQVWEKVSSKVGNFSYELATDIPRFGWDAPQPLKFKDLVPAQEELISVFKRCHNYIHGNQGLQKEPAFQELLKLIFCKVYDEDLTPSVYVRFFISNDERRSEIGQRRLRDTINSIFEDVKDQYPYIFAKNEQIRLIPPVLAYVVNELQRFSLLQTQADIKGTAYEQLVGSNLRGDRGEFFTPRNVCEMAVRMALATFPEEKWMKIRVCDPAAGTGGFLVSVMNFWREYLEGVHQQRRSSDSYDKAYEQTTNRLKTIARQWLSGLDFNPVLVRAAQMNLVMHGDGSTNVYHANSLVPHGEWPDDPENNVKNNIKLNSFDLVITNPPFGSKVPIDDPHILEQYELAKFEMNGGIRSSMPPEQLFIERCLQLLKDGGRMAIVLPDSILSNPGLAFIRRWILEKARIIASVDLPQVTFEPHTGTQTSVLLLQKKTREELLVEKQSGKPLDYEIFMTTPEAVGHDRRGEIHYLRTPEGELIEHEEIIPFRKRNESGQYVLEVRTQKKKMKFDQLPEVVQHFRHWVRQPERMRWING